jgi:ubiquinone/menaquinone biosynthesis C-methylase UbiE
VQNAAREEAQKQWNARACGELEGDKGAPEYFHRVEADRFRQQAWALDYFQYEKFAGRRVLEIGVGQGTDLMQFAKGGAHCYGVDITENHLALTQKHFGLRGKQVDLRRADATRLPFPDAFFDCVYSFGVIHHIPEIDTVIGEAHRVLKPGGVAMIALYYKWSAFHLFSKVLADGLLHGWLFSKGYAGLLSTVEDGADGVRTKPYIKLHDKRQMRALMARFAVEDVSVHQLEAEHFRPAPLAKRMEKLAPRLESQLGWYVACKARKR